MIRFVFSKRYCLIDQWFVFHNPSGFQTARCCKNCLRLTVINSDGEFIGCKASEDHTVYRTNTRARQHCNRRFRNHWHINDDAITRANTTRLQHSGNTCDSLLQFFIANRCRLISHRAVVDYCSLIGAAVVYVIINRVVAGIRLSIRKPTIERRITFVDGDFWRLFPVTVLGSL